MWICSEQFPNYFVNLSIGDNNKVIMKSKQRMPGRLLTGNEEICKIIASCTEDNVFVQDADLRYEMILNPQLGHDVKDIIGKTDYDLTSKDDAEKLVQIKKEVLSTGKSVRIDIPLISKTGEKEYFSGAIIPKSDSEGNINGLIGYFRNLTENVKAEKEFNLFFDLVPDMIVIASSDGYFKKLNKSWETILGFTMDELMSRPYVEFIHPEDVEPTFSEVAKQLSGKSTIKFTNRYLCKNGEYKWLEWVANPSPDGKNLYAAARDITEKKRIQDELRKSEERFSQVAKSAGIWIWEVDAQGKFTYCSESEESVLGYKPEELIGKKYFYDFFAPDTREELKNAALDAFSKKLSFNNFENPNVHKNGHLVILETSGIPLIDSNGNLTGYRGADKDITERKKIEKVLDDSEAKFRNAFLTNPDAITVTRILDGIYVSVNNGFKKIFGYTEEEVIGKTSLEIKMWYDPKDRSRFIKALKTTGNIENFEAKLCSKDRQVIDCLISAVIIELEGINHILTTTKDISGIKLAQQRLSESESKFRKIYEDGPYSMALVGKSLNFLMANNSFCRMLGYTEEEVHHLTVWDITYAKEGSDTESEDIRKLIGGEIPILKYEKQYIRKDRTVIWGSLTVTPNFDSDGIFLYNVAIIEDITRRKETEKALKDVLERLALATDASGIGIWDWDITKNELVWDQKMFELYGFTLENKKEVYETWLNAVHPADREKENEITRQAVAGEIPYETEFRVVWPDRTVHWLKAKGQVFRDKEGEVVRMVGVNYDITNSKQLELELNATKAMLQAAFDNSQAGIVIAEAPGGKLLYANKAATQISGTPGTGKSDKFVLEDYSLVGNILRLNGEPYNQKDIPLARAILNSETVSEEFIIRSDHQEDHIVLGNAAPILDEEGKVKFGIVVFLDITEKKRDEEQIRYQNERLNSIIKGIPDLIFVIDKNGKYLEVITTEPEKLLIPQNEIVGSNIRQAFNPELADLFLLKIGKVIANKEVETVEFAVSLTDSPSTHFEARISPLDEDKVIILSRDITSEVQKETEIKKLSLAVDQSPVSIVITDLKGNIEYANRAFEETTGYSLEEVIGKNSRILQSGRTDRILYQELWSVIRSGKEWHGEWVNRKKNGEFYWETVSISPIHDSIGAITNYLAVKLDISDRKRAEELLIQNEEKYRFMFVNNPQPMWIYDLETLVFLEVNDSAILHYGYSREEFLKMNLKDIRPKEDIEALLKDVQATSKSLNSAGEWRHLKKNGEIMDVEIYSHSITFKNRNARHVLVNDITKRKRAEQEIRELNAGLEERIIARTEELAKLNKFLLNEIEERKKAEIEIVKARTEAEQANMAKSEFLSRMSHELRTPMNSILGFAQLLEMGELYPAQKKGVNHIINSGKHLLDLINEILDISRIEAGRLALSIEPVQVSGIILEVIDSVQLLASKRHLNITMVSSESNQNFVNADRQRLKQILLNLLSNAVKYNKVGGSITVETKIIPPDLIGSAMLKISISDTGPGIPAADIPKLFMPFERIGAEKTLTEGTGLGLAVVHKLMEAMGGKNGVESVLGEGSTFWIELPVVDSQLSEARKSEVKAIFESKLALKKGTVLYIEDNISNLELVQQILSNECPGVQLLTETSGRMAFTRAKEDSPDLILLDLNLPDMHGSEALRLLKEDETTGSIPVVIISADAMPAQQKRLIQLGARKYLTKPLDVNALLKVIDEYIR